MPPPESHPRQLLVEGEDDEHSIFHLTQRKGFDWSYPASSSMPYIRNCGNKTDLLDDLSQLLDDPNAYRTIAVVIDADQSAASTWASIRDRMIRKGFPSAIVPSVAPPAGAVIDHPATGVRVGAWLMPDNQHNGELEDLLVTLVPAADP